jgi:RNA polymerase sigma factor (sigma-70 family)
VKVENRRPLPRLYNNRRIARRERMTMKAPQIVPVFHHLRRILARPDAGGSSDTQLLQRFVQGRDESAFELLVWRHGPMVLGVCRRLLRDEHDAEDAFQATLLILARKAGSIGKRESVGSWLYKVAYRVALRAREGALRRAQRERPVAELPAIIDPHPAGAGADELRPVLDEELSRLPEKQRAPVVLCYLEGLTNEEAAHQLRCPIGTIKTRLAQARRLLGERLARRGLSLAVVMPASAPPAALVGTTVRAATLVAAGNVSAAALSVPVACLMEGVLRAMMVTKVKWAAVVLAAGLAVAGVGTASFRALAEEPAVPQPTPAEVRVKRLREQIGELNKELRRAEEVVAQEKAVPPRKTPVAVIFGNVSITREELAEHLLSRMTTKQLEQYVNRRILEHVCKKEGIVVTAAEVDDCLKAEMKKGCLNDKAIQAQLQAHHMTLRDWKEDVIRTRLMLQKLQREKRITEKDLRREYEMKYGEKVECQFKIWKPGEGAQARQWARQFTAGRVTFHSDHRATINRHGTKERAALEEAAFALEPGEISPVIEMGHGGFLILKCSRRIPSERSVAFEDVRESLKRDIEQRQVEVNSSKLFSTLKTEARVKLLWTPPEDRPGDR